MSTIYKLIKRLNKLTAASLAGIILLLPTAGVAALKAQNTATTNSSNNSPATTKTSPFCSGLSSKAANINSNLNNLVNKAEQTWVANSQKLTQLWQTVDQKVASDRQNAANVRTQNFSELMNLAKTSTEQQAVQAYETAVNNAVNTRQTAYDSARATFRNAVEAAIGTRQSTISTQFRSFNTSVNSALQVAESSCSTNPGSGDTVRTTLSVALSSARSTFSSERKSDTTVNSQIQQLAGTRDSAFKTADQIFQTSMNTAATNLKQAFSSSST
jgi:hypothetical protein